MGPPTTSPASPTGLPVDQLIQMLIQQLGPEGLKALLAEMSGAGMQGPAPGLEATVPGSPPVMGPGGPGMAPEMSDPLFPGLDPQMTLRSGS